MALTKELVRTPTTIGTIKTTLLDGNGQAASRQGNSKIQVLDQNGDIMADKSHDLLQHLSDAQKAQIVAVMNMLRTEAQKLIT